MKQWLAALVLALAVGLADALIQVLRDFGRPPLHEDIECHMLSAALGLDANVGLFSTANPAAISSINRLDAVGFGLNNQQTCRVFPLAS